MDDTKKMKLIKVLWLITDIIVFIAAVELFIIGGFENISIAIIGIILLIVELILYKKGKILQ